MNKDTENHGHRPIVYVLPRVSAAAELAACAFRSPPCADSAGTAASTQGRECSQRSQGGHSRLISAGVRGKRGYKERWLAGGLLLAAALIGLDDRLRAQTLSDGSTPDLMVTVLVYCYAGVARNVLHSGEADASKIIGAAGVGTRWVDCLDSEGQLETNPGPVNKDCARQPIGAILTLRILPRSSPANTAFPRSVVGFAYGSSLASVLYGRVEDLDLDVDNNGKEIPVILGDAMAHELGHLLLGSNSHSRDGIMCGKWDRKYLREVMQGGQRFNAEQSELLRANVRNRLERPRFESRAVPGSQAAH